MDHFVDVQRTLRFKLLLTHGALVRSDIPVWIVLLPFVKRQLFRLEKGFFTQVTFVISDTGMYVEVYLKILLASVVFEANVARESLVLWLVDSEV
jgi:hypothetical protein